MDIGCKKRVTMKLKNPNPLFEKWLTEWRDAAIESDSKLQYCYTKALHSLRKYPLQLASGKDCKILQGFGEKLCQMLDEKLLEYKSEHPNLDLTSVKINNKRTSQNQEYSPAWRSGAYAILLTLHIKGQEDHFSEYMFKADIIRYGQIYCDKSFTKPDPGSYYTTWSSMKTLVDKKLVMRKGSPAKFSLTEEGRALALRLYRNHINADIDQDVSVRKQLPISGGSKRKAASNSNFSSESATSGQINAETFVPAPRSDQDVRVRKQLPISGRSKKKAGESKVTSNSNLSSESSGQINVETFVFAPNSFQIILLVDMQETGGSKSCLDDPLLADLVSQGISYESRHLKVGDYAWVCRQSSSDVELVLPYIVERKRMDDLGSSIKDGRFHEQKFRLKQCGLTNLVYLIESHGSNSHTGLPLSTLYQAATNTLVQDGFSVKFTTSVRDTAEYLSSFTLILGSMYKEKTLVSCPKDNLNDQSLDDDLVSLMTFQEFNKGAAKNKTLKVQELFVRQLLQLNGMSVDKALAINEKYPTPHHLRTAYQDCSDKEKLLAGLRYGKLGKAIGPIISKTIYQLYCSENFV